MDKATLIELNSLRDRIEQLELEAKGEIQEYEEEVKSALLQLAAKDLYVYISLAWKYAGTKSEFKPNWYVEAIAEHLQALYNLEIDKLAIAISPRFGKSSICSVIFPTWLWIQDPSFTIISSSYGESLAIRDAVKSRDLIRSKFFQMCWGDLFQLRYDINQKSRYENTYGGYRIATSVDGKGTGEGGDLLIVDDPIKAKEANSPLVRTNVINWYTDTMSSRYQDPTTFRQLVIHQRLHESDPIGYLTNVEGGWEILNLPVEYEGSTYITKIGWSDPRSEVGELIAPDVLPQSKVDEIKFKKPLVWATQYQQNPGAGAGGYIESSDIQYYQQSELSDSFDLMLTSWDLAEGEEEDTVESERSFSVAQVWGRIGSRKILIDQERGKWTFPQQLEAFKRLLKKYPNIKIHLIEKKSNGKAFIDTIRQVYKDLISSVDGLIPINPSDYGGSKIARFIACTPYFKAKEVYLPQESEKLFTKTVVYELKGFPRSKFCDCVDALSQAINWMVQNEIKSSTTISIPAEIMEKASLEMPLFNIPEEFTEIRNWFN